MNEKKKLSINAMLCDFRNVSEEVLKQYEEVNVKTMMAYVTEKSQVLLNRYGVRMDAMTVEKVGEDVRITENNGACRIAAGSAAGEKVYLIANGSLTIERNAGEALKSYVKITVNGQVIYPDSLADAIVPILTCNGDIIVYPERAELVEKTLTIDRIFAARAAADGYYYVTGNVYFTDPDANYDRLTEKKVRIQTKRAVVAESAMEAAVELLDGGAEIILVPDGCACVREDVVLDENFFAEYGSRVLIDADVTLEDAGVLEKMEFLQVTGRTLLNEKDRAAFLRLCKKHGELAVYRGILVCDIEELTIDKGMLEAAGEALTVMDCAEVKISADMEKAFVKDRLYLTDCACVCCPAELMGTIRLQATDVAQLVECGEDTKKKEEDVKEGAEVVHINTMKYVM